MYSITYIEMEKGTILSPSLPSRIKAINEISSKISQTTIPSIFCVNGLYGYRSGIIGYIFHKVSWFLSFFVNSKVINTLYSKIECSDLEAISLGISLITRFIPILNLKVWDPKDYIFTSDLCYGYNSSVPYPGINSIFRLSPLYDSGFKMFLNKKNEHTGFYAWDIDEYSSSKYYNKGVSWSIISTENRNYLVLNADILDIIAIDILKKCNHLIYLKNRLLEFYDDINGVIFMGNLSFTPSMDQWLLLEEASIIYTDNTFYVLGLGLSGLCSLDISKYRISEYDTVYSLIVDRDNVEMQDIHCSPIHFSIDLNEKYIPVEYIDNPSSTPKSQDSWHAI